MDERMKRSTYVWFEDTMGCGGSILVLRDGVDLVLCLVGRMESSLL
jgi:hypothetical protein